MTVAKFSSTRCCATPLQALHAHCRSWPRANTHWHCRVDPTRLLPAEKLLDRREQIAVAPRASISPLPNFRPGNQASRKFCRQHENRDGACARTQPLRESLKRSCENPVGSCRSRSNTNAHKSIGIRFGAESVDLERKAGNIFGHIVNLDKLLGHSGLDLGVKSIIGAIWKIKFDIAEFFKLLPLGVDEYRFANNLQHVAGCVLNGKFHGNK